MMDSRMYDMRIERTREEANGQRSNKCHMPAAYGDTTGAMYDRHLFAWKHVPSPAPWEVK